MRAPPAARALLDAALGFAYPALCLGCDDRVPPDEGHASALWTFDAGGTIRRLQHALKYGNRPGLGVALGGLMGRALRGEGAPVYDAVVAVPLARARVLERGYNQSHQLALGIAAALADATPPAPPVPGWLRRARATRSQTALSAARRWANVDGAFALGAGADVAGRRVLLVDDVLTTGATGTAAAAPVVAAGAHVDLAVLALAAV
jgi:predicted amidophosphoribosyltransferase